MRRIGLHFSILLAFVLLLQTVLAPAHCLMHAITIGFETVICTPEGTRSVLLTADGDPAPQIQAKPAFCAACHALPASPVLAVPVLPTPAWATAPATWHATARHLLPSARAPPFHPTGPPRSLS